jgi:hypothetical protein
MVILSNPWVVGIGTGILSGLLVTWLLSLFLSKKKDREFQQQVSSANREVIYAIRSGIPDNALPDQEIVKALIRSTARRHGLEEADLYQQKELTEELIKEVMDSSFLSATKKIEYCTELKLPSTQPEGLVDRAQQIPATEKESRRNDERAESKAEAFRISLIVGVLSGIATALTAFEASLPAITKKVQLLSKLFTYPVTTAFTVLAVAALISGFTERFEVVRFKRWQRESDQLADQSRNDPGQPKP